MNSENGRLGILGGGPAPGINSAISACAIEAASSGMQLYLSEGCAAIWKPSRDRVGNAMLRICAHLGVSIEFAPFLPGGLHRCDIAALGRPDGVCAGDGVERVEPVAALRLHSRQNQRHGGFAHVDDCMVRGVLGGLI